MKEFDKESERQNYRIRKGDKIWLWNNRKGDKIWLWNIHYKGLGLGKYIGSKRYTIFGIRMSIPIFKIKNKIIKGFECWWVPKKETDKGEIRKLITSGRKSKNNKKSLVRRLCKSLAKDNVALKKLADDFVRNHDTNVKNEKR